MTLKITAVAALAVGFAVTAWAQDTTPGGGPNSGIHEAVHPPSLSSPNVGQHPTSAPTPSVTPPLKGTMKRVPHNHKPKRTSGSSSAPH